MYFIYELHEYLYKIFSFYRVNLANTLWNISVSMWLQYTEVYIFWFFLYYVCNFSCSNLISDLSFFCASNLHVKEHVLLISINHYSALLINKIDTCSDTDINYGKRQNMHTFYLLTICNYIIWNQFPGSISERYTDNGFFLNEALTYMESVLCKMWATRPVIGLFKEKLSNTYNLIILNININFQRF